MKTIARTPIRDQVYRQILEGIVKGDLASGERVRDSDLAERLGISRTPVRETLLRLELEGFLESSLGRGFSVSRLERGEIEEVYPILWTLERLGLAMSGRPGQEVLDSMAALNARISGRDVDPVRLIDLDNEFHTTLLSGCGNGRLKAMIDRLKEVVRRYEYAYMSRAPGIGESVADHDAMIGLLRRGELDAAGDLLEKHWRRSLGEMKERLGCDDD